MRAHTVRRSSYVRGFSLVEVLIAATLVGLLSVGLISIFQSAQKGQKNIQNSVDFDVLKAAIQLVLGSSVCGKSFQTAAGNPIVLNYPLGVAVGDEVLGATPIPIPKIVKGNQPIAELNQDLGGGMVLSSIDFISAVFDGNQTIGATSYRAFLTTLKIEATKKAGSYGAPSLSKKFEVRLLANASLPSPTSGNIESCGPRADPNGVAVFEAAGAHSFTAPPMITSLRVEAWGGGGGGGSAAMNRGGGGGGGAYASGVYNVTPGDSYAIVVGSGGAGGTCAPGGLATAGSASSFAALVAAGGGAPGAPNGRWGGEGGTATSGAERVRGGNGGEGSDTGYGGDSPRGGFGGVLTHVFTPTAPPTPLPSNIGVPSAPGGGGAGGTISPGCVPGYAGAPGRVTLSW